MKKLTIIFVLSALGFSACFSSSNTEQPNAAQTKSSDNPNNSGEKANSREAQTPANKTDTTSKSTVKIDCLSIKIPGKKIDAKQTFPFDFEPFKTACFVTAHDPEFTDPPLGSEFFIYKDGKQIYKFPSPFNGVTTGCWAEGIAFQDLDEDGLMDVIVAGMCSAKTAPYSENMIYVNKGKEFTTNEEANYTLEKFKKIKDIADFVKRNKEQFFQ